MLKKLGENIYFYFPINEISPNAVKTTTTTKTFNVTELKKVRKKKAHVSLAKYKNRIKSFSHPF